ncbi:MAG: hypothetical protein CBD74_14900 [Saprospirales bacterium TMED214]|nr:MAG: hypothetical protein CBD74_14900 [Saprospirales bacterium TMED214]
MGFKTDQLKLRETYADNNAAGTPVDGTLALIGATGSKILKVRDNGSWASVVASGGATALAGLSDVPSAPAGGDQDKVCTINSSGQMVYGKLTMSNIHVDTIQVASESYADNDTTLMTSAAIQDHIQRIAATTHTEVKTSLSSDYAIPQTTVTKLIITGNPASYKWTLVRANDSGWRDGTVIEIINMSDHVQTIGRPSSGTAVFYLTNTGTQNASQEPEIGLGQRALILPKPSNNIHFITILSV